MVRFQRTAMPKLGKFPQAVLWAQSFAKYMKDEYDVEFRVYAQSDGLIYWVGDYPDYAKYGEVRTKIMSDSNYWGQIGRAAGLFIEESMSDSVMNLIG